MNKSRHRRGRRPGRHAYQRESLLGELGAVLRGDIKGTGRRRTVTVVLSVVAGTGLLVVAVLAGLTGLGYGSGLRVGDRGTLAGGQGPAGVLGSPGTPDGKVGGGLAGGGPGGGTPGQNRAAPAIAGDALNYLRRHGSSSARHATEARWSGNYLRVYTNLREYDDNSRAAVDLCRAASSYLTHRLGKAEPVVFVHAKESGNGHVVLANKLDAGDDCRVGRTGR